MPLSSTTLIAAFGVELKRSAASSFFLVALETRNTGRTWTKVPVPRGTNAGGLASLDGGQAIYAALGSSGYGYPVYEPAHPIAEQTSDGVHWHPAHVSCPARGPCLTLGPLQINSCGMAVGTQEVLDSGDGGLAWRPAQITGELQSCDVSDLYATGAHTVMLLNGMGIVCAAAVDGRWPKLECGLIAAAPRFQGPGRRDLPRTGRDHSAARRRPAAQR